MTTHENETPDDLDIVFGMTRDLIGIRSQLEEVSDYLCVGPVADAVDVAIERMAELPATQFFNSVEV